MCQVEGLDGIIECGRAVVGGASGVGQSTWVDSGNWAVLIVDVGGKFGILGMLTMSACLPATMTVVATLSLGRSISAATAIGRTLLLLGEFWVCRLALYSTKLVGLGGLTTTATRGTLLLKQESDHLDNAIGFQSLDLAR